MKMKSIYLVMSATAAMMLSMHTSAAPLAHVDLVSEPGSDVVNVSDRRNFTYYRGGYYLNGYLGSKYKRNGDINYNGYWYPRRAFPNSHGTSVEIYFGNRRLQKRHVARPFIHELGETGNEMSNDHVRWCDARYRSYRTYDDTFQPRFGPREQCRSPFSG